MSVHNFPKLMIDQAPSDQLKQWLEYDSPITNKLNDLTGNAELSVLSQGFSKPNWWDLYVLDIKDERIFEREILMKSNGIPYWYARTVIPNTCYQLAPDFFNRLNKESIRHLIFNQKQVIKINKLIYPIDSRCIEFYWVKHYIPDRQGILWVRIHEFELYKKASFYLIELLFPELEQLS